MRHRVRNTLENAGCGEVVPWANCELNPRIGDARRYFRGSLAQRWNPTSQAVACLLPLGTQTSQSCSQAGFAEVASGQMAAGVAAAAKGIAPGAGRICRELPDGAIAAAGGSGLVAGGS